MFPTDEIGNIAPQQSGFSNFLQDIVDFGLKVTDAVGDIVATATGVQDVLAAAGGPGTGGVGIPNPPNTQVNNTGALLLVAAIVAVVWTLSK